MHIKTAGGEKKIVMSRREWESIGKKAGWKRTEKSAGVHPLDRKREFLHGVEGPEENYYRHVWANLVEIIAEVKGISEKAFASRDDLHSRVDKALRRPKIMEIVDRFESMEMRPEHCAEHLYALKHAGGEKKCVKASDYLSPETR